jgi:hypothetical protein
MLTSIVIITSLITTTFKLNDQVRVTKGDFKDCTGTVLDIIQPPGEDKYDVKLTYCPHMWFKGGRLVEGIPESSLELMETK